MAYPGVLREADDQLLRHADELQAELEGFAAGGGEFVPPSFDPAAEAQAVRELAQESWRLSQWVSEVGAAFRAADSGEGGSMGFAERWLTALRNVGGGQVSDAVVVVPTADLVGVVGFPSRDVAAAQARQAAQELERLLTTPLDEFDLADLQALFDTIARGEYDPAFAATFSNAVGVEGYVDAVGLIRYLYSTADSGPQVSAEGPEYVRVLANTLTTALDTLAYIPDDERRYRASADLPQGLRLSTDFLDDLISGYGPQAVAAAAQPRPEDVVSGDDLSDVVWIRRMSQEVDLARDLSVLLSFADPPTSVAVDVANHRLTPWLDGPDVAIDVNAWVWGPNLAGISSNYATMLGRNPDASARWLSADPDRSGTNLERVLRRDSAADANGGAAFATVVKQGLTHPGLRTSVPGAPSYAQGPLLREKLMDIAIDTIADQGEIRNDNLHMAFAAGIEANIDHIADRINAPFNYEEHELPERILDSYFNTHDFLRDTMADVDAANHIRLTVDNYGREQVTLLLGQPDAEEHLRRLGNVQGVATEAETNALTREALNEIRRESTAAGDFVNVGVGLIPYAGTINDVAGLMGISTGDGVDWLTGELGSDFDQLDEAQQDARVRRAENKLHADAWLATALYESDTPEGAAFREQASGQPFVDDDESLIPYGSLEDSEDQQTYREWISSVIGDNQSQGPLYTEEGDIKAGRQEVAEGSTDVRDRQ